jgi:tetratricopeptide (TPR) repeat protein
MRAAVSDSGLLPLKEWQAEYGPGEARFIPTALAGIVTGALHLPPVAGSATVNAAAAADFSAGVGLARRDDRLDAAIPLLERAAATDADSPLPYARLAEAWLRKYSLAPDPAQLERAKGLLAKAEKRNPDVAAVWLAAGMLGEYSKVYAAGEAALQRARELEPRNADVWRHLGGVYVGSNRLGEAEIAYRKAVELDPGYFKNYQELCLYYGEHGNYEEAVRQCEKGIALAPDLASIHLALAKVHVNSGRYVEGERESNVALRLDPTSSNLLQTLAIALADQRRYEEAIPLFEKAATIGPPSEIAFLNLGTMYRLANRPEQSRKAYEAGARLAREALRRNLNDAGIRADLSYLYAWLGDRQQAEYEADQAWQFAPGSVDVAQLIVLTYEALGERARTLEFAANAPPEALRRLKHDKQPDLANLHKDSRFTKIMDLHHIQ